MEESPTNPNTTLIVFGDEMSPPGVMSFSGSFLAEASGNTQQHVVKTLSAEERSRSAGMDNFHPSSSADGQVSEQTLTWD